MSSSSMVPGTPASAPTRPRVTPDRTVGWWALGLSAAGFAAWIILPIITTVFRETYPITDTFVMPIIGVVAIDVAAVFDLLALTLWKQRSLLNIVATALTIPAALFFTFMVVGEGLAGV